MHNELYGIWYMENRQGQFIYVISGNQTEIHRAFWQIEKLCSRESPQKKKSEKFAQASRFQGGYALGEIQHSPLSIVVGGWVCGISPETMADFVIYCLEVKVHTFWEGHKALTKSPKNFELQK